jgi:hypothetical protein
MTPIQTEVVKVKPIEVAGQIQTSPKDEVVRSETVHVKEQQQQHTNIKVIKSV